MASTLKEPLATCYIDKLHRVLATFTPDERRLILHYYGTEPKIQSRKDLSEKLGIPMSALRVRAFRLRHRLLERLEAEGFQGYESQLVDDALAIPSATEPSSVSPAPVSTQPTHRQAPLLEDLRHLLQAHCPVLYAEALEPTLADLRQEHSAALAEGRPLKARRILLQGYGALAAAAVCQLGFSLLGRIAALWWARSPK